MEEGRRRRYLYEERRWAAQSELRRVLAERVGANEKEGMLRLLLKVCNDTVLAREYVHLAFTEILVQKCMIPSRR